MPTLKSTLCAAFASVSRSTESSSGRSTESHEKEILCVSDFEFVSSGNFFIGLPDRFPFGGISMMNFASEGLI